MLVLFVCSKRLYQKIYYAYNEDGLEIISISLDDYKKAWKETIDKVDLPWLHLCDFKGRRSVLTKSYSIYGIPFIMTLDERGTIIYIKLLMSFGQVNILAL